MSITQVQSLLETINPTIIGITGRAGSGKTTLAKLLGYPYYSIDYRFIGDSNYRKNYIESKSQNFSAYLDACNQYNWWDWNKVYTDITSFKKSGHIKLESTYDRDTGKVVDSKTIMGDKLIVEGALLGSFDILNLLDTILFINVEDDIRLERLLEKDSNRRTITEILVRFLITNYSESLYYNNTLLYSKVPMYVLDINYDFKSTNLYKLISFTNYIPVKVSI